MTVTRKNETTEPFCPNRQHRSGKRSVFWYKVHVMESRTDKELLDSYVADGDEPAFAELVARYHPMVYRTCWRLLGNDHDAEDAAQAAFLVLARKAGSLRQEGRLNGWLHRVARLTALEAVRKRAARERHQTEFALGGGKSGCGSVGSRH